jgi:hypothetical protein
MRIHLLLPGPFPNRPGFEPGTTETSVRALITQLCNQLINFNLPPHLPLIDDY